nr:MAG: polyprotein [Iflaviridae sp.]
MFSLNNQQQNVESVRINNNALNNGNRSGRRSVGNDGLHICNAKSTTNLYKSSASEDAVKRVFRFVKPFSYTLLKDCSYASAFNSWISVYSMSSFTERITNTCTTREQPRFTVIINGRYTTLQGILNIKGRATDNTVRQARELAYLDVFKRILGCIPIVQMDTVQGDAIQKSDQENNTIITRDADQTKSEEMNVDPVTLPIICSTEPMHEFDSVMNRWMALDGLEIKATAKAGDAVETYHLPSFLYKASLAPNMMPFENFIYGTYNIEFKFVVNANKFHVGKVLVSVKYDSYQMEERRNSLVSALCRPHITLDLAVNNEGVLAVPFKYHRTFVRNAKQDNTQFGIKRAHYASVHIQVLSPLGAIAGAAQSMYIRPFFRIKKAKLTGMSYRVALVQGDGLDLESLLKVVGTIANLDRPVDLKRQQQVIPKARLHFCAGKGPIDSVPMRMDPSTLTTYLTDHHFPEDPTDMMQIAQVWGLSRSFTWTTSDAEGKAIASVPVDPTYHCGLVWSGTPVPLEYVASMYQFWSGTIEVRLDFVSNAFHTGSVMLSAEFGRDSDSLTKSASTYTKTFHLGDQKSCTFTIPYIYDTPYRRTSCVPWSPVGTSSVTEATEVSLSTGQVALLPEISARFKVRVINKLVPIQSTTQTVEVLMFVRGGRDFTCHSPIMANLINDEVMNSMDSFPGSYAVAQMDNGEQEDLDPTADFKSGVPRDHVMSSDNHTNIKDLLRRPVQIVNNYTVDTFAKKSGLNVMYIPCMPPSRMCGWKKESSTASPGVNSIYAQGLIRSYHSHILDLFRFWRGSQRFTFLFNTRSPVFVSFVPHSGARVMGNIEFSTADLMSTAMTVSPSTMGLSTEIVLPNINPSVVIEAPYELENNFALMQEQYNTDNYTWRDKADTNSGHLIIWSHYAFTCDVWWSAGDDFEVSNFYGMPPCVSFVSPFFRRDNLPRTQMEDDVFVDAEDFQSDESEEVTSQLTVFGKLRKMVTPYVYPLGVAAVSQVPIVGPTLAGSALVHRTNQTLTGVDALMAHTQQLTEQFSETVASTTDLVQTTNNAISELAKILSLSNVNDTIGDVIRSITEKIGSFVEIGSHLYHVVLNVVIDIIVNLHDFNYRTLALSVVRFIANITGLAVLKLTTHLEQVIDYFRVCFSVTSQGDTATEHLSAGFWTEDILKQGLGLFVSLIGTAVGISVDKKQNESWTSSVMKRLCSSGGMSFVNGTMRFVETIFLMIKEAVFVVLKYFSIENRAIIALRDKSKTVDNFMHESQLMMNEVNVAQIHNPEFKIRFWTNVVNAYEIQKIIATVPTNKISPILAKTCNDVIRLGKEKMADLRSSPIRYEPFVICIEGPSKIGKSFATTPLATELLHAIGYKCSSNNPIYYRIQGSKFWNDYIDQPCVVLDEWMNLSDPQSVLDGVRELFQLKSPAVFIPEQAAIEEKKIRANPKLVIILTNTPFPDNLINNAVTCSEAVYRRRDVLIRATLKPEAQGVDLHGMSKEDKVALKHLNFQLYENQTRADSLCEDRFDYQGILDKLKERFVRYDREESENVKIRMAQLQKFWQVKTLNLTDPFSLFYEGILHTSQASTSQLLPSEILEVEVAKLANVINGIENAPETSNQEPVVEGMMQVTLLASIATMSIRSLCQYVQDWKPPVPASGIHCCICDRDVTIFASCRPSYELFIKNGVSSVLHVMCRTCSIGNSSLGSAGCPMCRAKEFVPVIPAKTMGLIKTMWQLKKAQHKIWPFVKTISPAMVTSALVAIDFLNMLTGGMMHEGKFLEPLWVPMWEDGRGFVITTCSLVFNLAIGYISDKVFWRDEREALRRRIVDAIECHITYMAEANPVSAEAISRYRATYICPHQWKPSIGNDGTPLTRLIQELDPNHVLYDDHPRSSGACRVIPQMEEITHTRAVFRPRQSEVGDMQYWFNELMYTRDWDVLQESTRFTGDSTHQTCLHADLVDLIPTASWEDGAFMVPTALCHRRVEWTKCKEYCVLEHMDKKHICKEYFDHHKTAMFMYVSQHYHTDEFKHKYKNKLPSFMYPHWLDMASFTIKDDENTWLGKLDIPAPLMLVLKAVGISVAVFAAFKGLQALGSFLFGAKPSSQIISSGDAVIRKFKPEIKKLNHRIVSPQGSCDDAVTSKVVGNYFVVRVSNLPDGTTKQLVGLGIKQRTGILPRHYYEFLRDQDHERVQITIGPAINLDHGVAYSFCDADFLQSDVSDLAVFYLPTSFNMFKDITRYFGTDADLNGKHSPLAQMVRVPTRTEKYISIIQLELKGYKKRQTIAGPNGVFTSLDNLEYNYSQSGACGSAVLIHNHTRPIRGIHIAGVGKLYGGVGYAALITQEDLEIIPLSPSTVHVQGIEEPDFLDGDIKLYLPENSVVNYKGAVSKQLIPFSADKSSIKPSKIAEDLPWQTTKAPAILSKRDPRYAHELSPLLAGCAKHGYLTRDFRSDQLEEVAMIRGEELLVHAPLVLRPSKLTINEAVVGLPQMPHYEGIKMNTSAGWPYCTTQRTTKDQWTEIIRDEHDTPIDCVVHPEVVDEVRRKEELRKQGIVPVTLFVDTLKDEKKSLTKIPKLGSTRVFCSSPYDFTIAMRQNFLHFVAMYYENRDALKHSVGISMVGPEVTQLVTDLLSVGNNIVTLDYSNFGPGFNASVAATIKRTMVRWISENVSGVNEAELECLVEENINSHHLMAGTVYQQRGGSPSGSPITVVINSEVNITYIMLAWLNVASIPNEKNRWDEFNRHVVLRVYGDDLIMSVSDAYIDVFNGETIMNFFKSYGIVATDATKSASIVRSTGIAEASYLKHTFHPHPVRKGEWLAALDMESVRDTPLWIQEPIQINEATRVNAEAAIRNAYGHGPQAFNEFRDKINEALRKNKIAPVLLTWSELDKNFFSK